MITHSVHYPQMHIYISYIDILSYTQGGKHAASACKGGIYPHKKGSTTWKREQMIRGDRLSIKPVAGTVHLERKKGQMVGIKASVEKGPRADEHQMHQTHQESG